MDLKHILNLGRSDHDKMIGGVCAGIAETTDTPPWVWRAIALFTLVWGGTGGILYVILWVVWPLRGQTK